ncbi:hypothetical protein Ancab_014440 [Ancistrocladus abbreviatus]
MKNLDSEVTEAVLQEKFSQFGKIVSLAIARDENGASKGFGFINFESPNDTRQAMESMNGSQLGSKTLYMARAQKKVEREQLLCRQYGERRKEQMSKYMGSNVYIKNIIDDVSDEEVRELFSQCGTITSAKLMRDDKGKSKGFGFVCYSSPDEAGYMFHQKPLYVAIAQRKKDRQAQLRIQYAQRMVGLNGASTTVVPGGYPPLYCTAAGVVSQLPPQQGLMYQTMGVRQGWRGNGFAPATRPAFQPLLLPVISTNARQKRQGRGRMNSHTFPQNGGAAQSVVASKESPNQQRTGQVKYVPSGHCEENKVPGVASLSLSSDGTGSPGSENLSSMHAAATFQQQKQIHGKPLYPLVENHRATLIYMEPSQG